MTDNALNTGPREISTEPIQLGRLPWVLTLEKRTPNFPGWLAAAILLGPDKLPGMDLLACCDKQSNRLSGSSFFDYTLAVCA